MPETQTSLLDALGPEVSNPAPPRFSAHEERELEIANAIIERFMKSYEEAIAHGVPASAIVRSLRDDAGLHQLHEAVLNSQRIQAEMEAERAHAARMRRGFLSRLWRVLTMDPRMYAEHEETYRRKATLLNEKHSTP